MAEGTDVVPDAVREFGRAVVDSQSREISGALQSASPAYNMSAGTSQIPEAVQMMESYSRLAGALQLFLVDSGYGMQALTYTSATVAWNYENGDTSQAAQMQSVDGSFHPPAGTTTIQSQAAEAEAEAAAARAAERRFLHGIGADDPATTATGVQLTQAELDAAADSPASSGDAAEPDDDTPVSEMTPAQRIQYVQSQNEDHQEEMRQASATYQAVAWDAEGYPTEYAYVAPDSYQESSAAGEEAELNTQGDYAEAQEWAAQEEADGYEATVTVDDDGEVHQETTRPPTPYNDWSASSGSSSATGYQLASGGGT